MLESPKAIRLLERTFSSFSRAYFAAIRTALFWQLGTGVLSALVLDGGRVHTWWRIIFVAHWVAILVILVRRPLTPTQFDLYFIRYGMTFLLLIAILISPIVYLWIGESDLSGLDRLRAL